MKIIHRGQNPEPAIKWWVGQQFTCDNCTTVVQLELTERHVTEENERRPNGKQEIRFCCPVCDVVLVFTKPR